MHIQEKNGSANEETLNQRNDTKNETHEVYSMK